MTYACQAEAMKRDDDDDYDNNEEDEKDTIMSGRSPSGLDPKLELLVGTFLGFDTKGPAGKALKYALITTYELFVDLDVDMPLSLQYPNSSSKLIPLPDTAAHGLRRAVAYHQYLESSSVVGDGAKADDPNLWDKKVFRLWVKNDMDLFLGTSPITAVDPDKKKKDEEELAECLSCCCDLCEE